MITLFDLAARDERLRFSSPCWRVRMALKHMELPFETTPWRYHEKERIAFSGSGMVPVLIDGDAVVHESWAIAEYLEDRYPDRPSLFPGKQRALGLFIKRWVEISAAPALARAIIPEVHSLLHEEDRDYFRRTREEMFGATLEQLTADREEALRRFRAVLAPVRSALGTAPYLCGDTPGFADYALFGHFVFARAMSRLTILEPDDPILAWRNRLLTAFDGYAGSAMHHGA